MTIYKGRTPANIYRKIYEQHYGPIPKEDNGRTYEIHHIDGDDSNNDPSNLVALTLQEHYDLHYSQGDYQACRLMAIQRMNKTPEEISELSRLAQLKLLEEGRHHFIGDSHPSKIRSRDGSHYFYTSKFSFPGQSNGNYNHTIYDFVNTKTGEQVSLTLYDFSKTYSLPVSNVCSMITGKFKNKVGDWTLLGRDCKRKVKIYDTEIYKFVNSKSNEIIQMTRQQFIISFNADKGSVSKLLSGDVKSVKGWAILHGSLSHSTRQ
jgi:hypothetical protein